jgi:hypothetical protein
MYSSPKKLDCFYREQLDKSKNKQEKNGKHQQDFVTVDDDGDEEDNLNGEASDNEDDAYLFESPGSFNIIHY